MQVAARAEGLGAEEEGDSDPLAAEPQVEPVSAAVASVNLLVLRSHSSHIKHSVRGEAALGWVEVHSIAGYKALGVPDVVVVAAVADVGQQQRPSMPSSPVAPVEEEEDREAEEAAGECNSVGVRTGFCS
jgi:hypothetical protein